MPAASDIQWKTIEWSLGTFGRKEDPESHIAASAKFHDESDSSPKSRSETTKQLKRKWSEEDINDVIEKYHQTRIIGDGRGGMEFISLTISPDLHIQETVLINMWYQIKLPDYPGTTLETLDKLEHGIVHFVEDALNITNSPNYK